MEETITEETTTEQTTAVEVGGSPELAEAAEGYEEYVVEQTACSRTERGGSPTR